MVFIELEDVIKIYPGKLDIKVQALRGVSLTLTKGKYYALIGPSGSGKTTLLNLISAYDQPTAGKIEIDGLGILASLTKDQTQRYHLRDIGIIQQQFDENLFMDWSVQDNIMFPMRLLNRTSYEEQKKKTLELTKFLGLEDKLKRKAETLSGGEAQRASIAVALANDPRLIVADEPTGNLDSSNTLNIVKLFKNIIKDYDTTILVVTHNPLVANNADMAWKLVDGRIEGIYQKEGSESGQELLNHEFTFIDKNGMVKIPEDILQKAKLADSVEIIFNETTKRIEIFLKKRES